VAGMLRSFSYARWSALRRLNGDATHDPRLSAPAAAWERDTRAAFLQAYAEAGTGAGGPAIDALREWFEIEKALYELRYELDNRTDWAEVPLRGLLDLLQPPTAD
jgi:maltose alpha-D-glucosyltransferase/alpha-amylase